MQKRFRLTISKDSLDAETALFGHGWIYLAPNTIGGARNSFQRPMRLSSGKRCRARISVNGVVVASGWADDGLRDQERKDLRDKCRYMLRLDEQFHAFHDVCSRDARLAALASRGAGRLLRSPTVFEDVVKTICTTNCSWQNTKLMISRLCDLGGGDFPTAEDIVTAGQGRLDRHVRAGYRVDYIYDFAEQVCSSQVDLDRWREDPRNPAVVEEIKRVRGIGPYALNHILMMLGRYDVIPVDSEVLSWLRTTYHRGRNVSAETATRRYNRFGDWRFLAYKFDRISRRSNYID